MIFFVFGTLVILVLLAWGTYRTAEFLRRTPPTFNLLLLPTENALRLVLIGICLGLGEVSGLGHAQFGWTLPHFGRDAVVGFGVGLAAAMLLPLLTRFAVSRLGKSIYSPLVIQSVLPRSAREWVLVPAALVPMVLLEELLFRSLLLGGFAVLVPAIVLAASWSLLFGVMHVPQGALGIAVAAGMGLLLSGLFLVTASLVAPFVAHYVINLVQLIWASVDRDWLAAYQASQQPTESAT